MRKCPDERKKEKKSFWARVKAGLAKTKNAIFGGIDDLLKHFGKNAPSAGFVVVLDSLMNALQRQKIAIETGPERVTITYRPEEREKAHREAAALRAEGRYVELILED